MSLFDKIGSLREDASQPENRMSADRLRRYKSVKGRVLDFLRSLAGDELLDSENKYFTEDSWRQQDPADPAGLVLSYYFFYVLLERDTTIALITAKQAEGTFLYKAMQGAFPGLFTIQNALAGMKHLK